MQRLDLENAELWGNTYLPTARTIGTTGSDEGKIKIINTGKPLLYCVVHSQTGQGRDGVSTRLMVKMKDPKIYVSVNA